jgi:hypothetical protein
MSRITGVILPILGATTCAQPAVDKPTPQLPDFLGRAVGAKERALETAADDKRKT